jgi:hypothetical protein
VRNCAAARAAAFVIAAIAWTGLAVQFAVLYQGNGSATATLWSLLAYFTMITNFLVAAQFTAIAAGWSRFGSSWALAGGALSICLVGVVYELLLSRLYHLTGGAAFSNVLLHRLTPTLVPLFWLTFARKGALSVRDPLLWAAYPVAYFVYALARGAATGFYPYPFMDVSQLGWTQTLVNAALIALGYLIAGWALVLLDGWLARASWPPKILVRR